LESERLSDLDGKPDLGEWFEALRAVMSDGDPPVQRYDQGDTIMRAGDVADRFLVVLSGTAAVLGASEDEPPLGVVAGALLGELGVLFGGRRRRTVVATSPVVSIAGTRAELERALQVEAIGSHVASVAARRLAERVEPVPATTSKGLRVLLRPLLPADRPRYLDALGKLSLETLRKRFFVAYRPPDSIVKRLIDIDYVDHVAWVAVDPAGPGAGPLGVCRLIVAANDPSAAEIAVGVVEAHQDRGLGALLVGTLGAVAQARGLATITGQVLDDNRPMRALCDKARASWTRPEPGVVEARMAVADVAALLDPATAGRVAAATRELGQAARLADA
jgi:CRP-like cAMP-binding protein